MYPVFDEQAVLVSVCILYLRSLHFIPSLQSAFYTDRFNNITEEECEDCKSLIYEVIQNEMGIDTANIKFHAVHRVGKKIENRCRPIIVHQS